jgi:hypothetical protein
MIRTFQAGELEEVLGMLVELVLVAQATTIALRLFKR